MIINNFQCSLSDEQYQGLKTQLHTFVTEHLSGQIQFSCCRILPKVTLTSEELVVVKNAVDKRQQEFSAGRRCAKKCLENYGISSFSLIKGAFGEPVWPQKFTGSITHNSGVAIAAAMPWSQGTIGIDFIDLSEQLSGPELILNTEEMKTQLTNKLPNPELMLFSMKESAIKIISPLFKEYVEFKDIKVMLENETAEITYRDNKVGISLFWSIYENYAFTMAIKAEKQELN